MDKFAPQQLRVEQRAGVVHVTLARPDVHNAFNADLIEELSRAFLEIAAERGSGLRAVVLAGDGPSFCAGADVNWMRASLEQSEQENVADAHRMARMFEVINTCPLPVIGRLHGATLGGGVGLAAVCDMAVAAEGTVFAFSEAKLGLAPAVISPFVLAKIGQSHARALFLSAERFSASRALQIGLIHGIAPLETLDEEVARLLREIKTSGPNAVSKAKSLLADVGRLDPLDARQYTAETIAQLRVSTEGQEGLRAFLDKRRPDWAQQ